MALDLNNSPYWDDYNETKQFHKILFKPGYAVQARELTQLQTILQNQINKFGDHVFKNGAVVSGCDTKLDNKLSFIKLETPSGSNAAVTAYIGQTIEGGSGLTAVIVDAVAATVTDPATFYLRYTSGDGSSTQTHFTGGETLTVVSDTPSLDGDIFTVADLGINQESPADNYFGYATRFTLEDGIIYLGGNFVRHVSSSIYISKYTNYPSGKVCVGLVEEIIDATEDEDLQDPAEGSYNFAAPGADRYKLSTDLIFVPEGTDVPENYYQIVSIVGGAVSRVQTSNIYSILGDNMARRTYDESGNYAVKPFPVLIREHLNVSGNNGLLTTDEGGNANFLAVGLEAGKAYVRGYEHETRQTEYVVVEKGIDTVKKFSVPISSAYGNYIEITDYIGAFDISGGQISLRDAVQNGVSSSPTSPAGNEIGTARVRHISYINDGTNAPGSAGAKYRLYIYDIKMTSGDFANDVQGIYYNGSVDAYADVVLTDGVAVIKETQYNNLLYRMPSKATKTIKPAVPPATSGNYATQLFYTKVFAGKSVSSGNTTLTLSGDEVFIDGGNTASETYIYENLLLVKESDGSVIDLTAGGINVDASDPSSQTITITGLGFTGNVTAYATVEINNAVPLKKDLNRSVFVAFDLSMVIPTTGVDTTGNEITYSAHKLATGDKVKYSSNGGTAITGLTSGTTYYAIVTGTGTFKLALTLSDANAGTAIDLTGTGNNNQYFFKEEKYSTLHLGVSDVYKIVKIYASNAVGDSYSAIYSSGIDITSDYSLDNGQRDNFYGLATLNRKPGGNQNLEGKDVLVEFDYFTHTELSSTAGYFAVDSYPVNDAAESGPYIKTQEIPIYVSPTSGESYDLRDTLDFRPRMADTVTPVTLANIASVPVNPTSTETVDAPSFGLTIPKPDQEMDINYEYYLGRKDRIIIDDNGVFSAVHGTPSLTPVEPGEPENAMSLAIVTIPPYPSLAANVAKSSGRPEFGVSFRTMDNRRYTMRDIGAIEQRVARIEYYTSLSLLEKATESLFIPSAADPTLNRFKHGILVDAFTGHNVGNPSDAAYKCSIDPYKQELRPFFHMENIDLIFNSATSAGIKKTGDLLTLPYNHTPLASNPFASKARNCVGEMLFNYVGDMQLDPPVDNWTDTAVQPDVAVNFDGNYDNWQTLSEAWGTQWGDWQDLVTGRRVNTDTTVTGGQTRVSGDTLFQDQIQIATTTTTQRQTRQGIQLNVTPETVTQRLGAKVTNTSLIPYMRSITVTVKCQRLKPNTRVYPFFDGIAVSEHCRPLSVSALSATPTDPAQYSQYANGAYGDALVSDSDGVLVIQFRIPANTFRVGSKNFRVCDDPFNRTSFVTTSATQTFSANGISQNVQDTVVSTREATLAYNSVSDSRSITESSTAVNRLGERVVGTVQNTTVNNNFTTINNNTNVTNISNNTTVVNNTNVVNTTVNNVTSITNIIETPDPVVVAEPELPTVTVVPTVTPPPVVIPDPGPPPEPVVVFPVLPEPEVQPPVVIFEPEVPTEDPIVPVFEIDLSNIFGNWPWTGIMLDPLAQSFYVSGMPFGTFVTALDVYFRTKSETAPITLQIREMFNGIPTQKVVPFGEVTLTPSQVAVSTESGTGAPTYQATRFTFPSPVYLQNNTEYCFVLLPAGNDPNYNVWVSELGENEVGTTNRISEQPNVGMLFTSANNRTWTPKQSEDIKFTLYRAMFDTSTVSTVQFENSDYDYLALNSDMFLVSDDTTTTTKFAAGEKVYVEGYESTKFGYVKQYDSLYNVIKVIVEDGEFAAGDTITNGTIYTTIDAVENKNINTVQTNIGFMEFGPTTAIWSYAMTAPDATTAGTVYERMTFGEINELSTEGAIFSKSNETADLAGNKSFNLRVGMTTATDTVSPVIDLRKCSLVSVANSVNSPEVLGETSNSGNALSKYISRRVILENEAEDLKVYLSNYIPSGTDVKVFGKFLNSTDSSTFDDLDWIELETTASPLSSTAASGFVEYEYSIPDANKTADIFNYTRDGVTYTRYTTFAVKIVLLSNNSSVVPKCKELRAIALQV